ncbi:hypothetical protein SAMN05661091_4864 [Paenibacillus uliginis N3/975]|uniref:DUF4367 domain-containing protein n=1 Tax=Paenibacillus uliginis N3/975 TaxID=1313296 RepID=A0A1X7HQN4_9BACL|nr:hypothetical protein [Paenibacillus uliginis]SMF90027.1 hypothetical protein SAMN05661091_4864 [Paenibacillus uliginis N3/975]
MQKIILLLVTFLICFAPVAYAVQDEAVEPFTWDGEYVEQLKKVNIPLYVPTYVASSEFSRKLGQLFVSKLEVSKDRYLFHISRQRVHDGEVKTLAFDVMTMSAGTLPAYRKQPFSTYDMFKKPEGTTRFEGYDVEYFADKKAFIWENNGWEYLVWAKNTNNAINIMKRVMATIPKGANPVQGAIKGQVTTFDTNEGVQSDAGWSYDNGKTWYIITGRTTPEQLIKVLKSMVKLDTK